VLPAQSHSANVVPLAEVQTLWGQIGFTKPEATEQGVAR
jgi:hypothetical protein